MNPKPDSVSLPNCPDALSSFTSHNSPISEDWKDEATTWQRSESSEGLCGSVSKSHVSCYKDRKVACIINIKLRRRTKQTTEIGSECPGHLTRTQQNYRKSGFKHVTKAESTTSTSCKHNITKMLLCQMPRKDPISIQMLLLSSESCKAAVGCRGKGKEEREKRVEDALPGSKVATRKTAMCKRAVNWKGICLAISHTCGLTGIP